MTQDAPLPVVGMSQYLPIAPRASHPYSSLASPRPPEPLAYVCDRSGAGHSTGVPLVHAEPGVVRCPECGARYVEPLDAAVLRLSVEVAALREASQAAKGPGFVAGGIAPDDRPRMMRVLAMACVRAAGVTVDMVRTGISFEGDSFDRTNDARRILARLCEAGLLTDVSSGLEPSRYEVTKKGRAVPPALCANGCCSECPRCAAQPDIPILCDDCVRRREACAAARKPKPTPPKSSDGTSVGIDALLGWLRTNPAEAMVALLGDASDRDPSGDRLQRLVLVMERWADRHSTKAQATACERSMDDAGILRPVTPGVPVHAGETVLACPCGWAGIAATLKADGGCPSCAAGRPVAAGWVAEAQPGAPPVGIRVAPGVGVDVTAKTEVTHGRGAVVSAVNGGLPACGAGGPTTGDITAVTCDDPACLSLAQMEAKALRALAGLSAAGETAEFIARTSHLEHEGLPLALLGLVSRRLATRTMRGTMSVYAITERGRRVAAGPPPSAA